MITIEDHFSLRYIKVEARGQNRGYNQRNYQSGNRLDNRSGSRDRRQFGQGNERPRSQQNYRRNNFQESTMGYRRQSSRGEYRNDRCNDYNRSRDRSRENHPQGIIVVAEIEAQAIVGRDQDLEPVPIGTE